MLKSLTMVSTSLLGKQLTVRACGERVKCAARSGRRRAAVRETGGTTLGCTAAVPRRREMAAMTQPEAWLPIQLLEPAPGVLACRRDDLLGGRHADPLARVQVHELVAQELIRHVRSAGGGIRGLE